MKIKLGKDNIQNFKDFDFTNFLKYPILTDGYNKMGPTVGIIEEINEEYIIVKFKNKEIEDFYKNIKNLKAYVSHMKNRKGKYIALSIDLVYVHEKRKYI